MVTGVKATEYKGHILMTTVKGSSLNNDFILQQAEPQLATNVTCSPRCAALSCLHHFWKKVISERRRSVFREER